MIRPRLRDAAREARLAGRPSGSSERVGRTPAELGVVGAGPGSATVTVRGVLPRARGTSVQVCGLCTLRALQKAIQPPLDGALTRFGARTG